MSRIFISYKRADKEKVFAIKNKIESATGEQCWIDIDGIESDAQFVDIIMKAIDEAAIVLFMYSRNHALITDYKQDWTVREISYAQAEDKHLVFVNIDQTPLSKWFKFMFPQQQQVDATSPEAMDRLMKDINRWLGNNPKSISIPEVKPMTPQPTAKPYSATARQPISMRKAFTIPLNKKYVIGGAIFVFLVILGVIIGVVASSGTKKGVAIENTYYYDYYGNPAVESIYQEGEAEVTEEPAYWNEGVEENEELVGEEVDWSKVEEVF